MKAINTTLRTIICGLLLGCPLLTAAQTNLKDNPAYLRIDEVLDVKQASPEVNVNLPRFLLLNALSEFDNGPEDPFAAAGINLPEIVKEVQLIRVVIIESTPANRAHVDSAVTALRQDLASKWNTIVSIPDENIGVYAVSDSSGEKLAGLAVLIADDGDVIIGNVVGNLPLGKILKLAAQIQGPNGDLIRRALSEFTGMAAESKTDTGSADTTAKAKE
jgi:hypothetical protein